MALRTQRLMLRSQSESRPINQSSWAQIYWVADSCRTSAICCQNSCQKQLKLTSSPVWGAFRQLPPQAKQVSGTAAFAGRGTDCFATSGSVPTKSFHRRSLMTKKFSVLFALSLAFVAAVACSNVAAQNTITGEWQGSISKDGSKIYLNFERRSEDGRHTSSNGHNFEFSEVGS